MKTWPGSAPSAYTHYYFSFSYASLFMRNVSDNGWRDRSYLILVCFNIRSLIFPCFCHEYKSSICVKNSVGRCIEADKEVQLEYIKKSQPIPRCCLDKHNDYCCSLNLVCYDTIDQCTANCSISLSSATVSSSSSSSVLPWNQIIITSWKERRMNKRK